MKLYSFYTDSHACFKDDWFIPSITKNSDVEVCLEEFLQPSDKKGENFGTESFNKTMHLKIELILTAIEENWEKIFIYADIDIQFFKPLSRICNSLMNGIDILFQLDSPSGTVCAGMFVCKANPATKHYFERVLDLLRKDSSQNDQDIINGLFFKDKSCSPLVKAAQRALRLNRHATRLLMPYVSPSCGLKWGYLPTTFMSAGTFTGQQWNPGDQLIVSKDLVLHHANWTTGVKNKLIQLQHVKERVTNGYGHQLEPRS